MSIVYRRDQLLALRSATALLRDQLLALVENLLRDAASDFWLHEKKLKCSIEAIKNKMKLFSYLLQDGHFIFHKKPLF